MKRLFQTAVLLVGLSGIGCSANRYTPVAEGIVDLPEDYAVAVDSPSLPEGLPPAPEVCSDLGSSMLRELTEAALADNFSLAVAAARLRQAEAVAVESGAPLWPQVNASLSASRSDSGGLSLGAQGIPGGTAGTGGTGEVPTFGTGPRTVYQPSIAASYEVDLWGKLRQRRAAAALDAQASAQALHALGITVTSQIADTWAQLLAQRQLIDLLDQQVEVSSKFLELTRLRFGQGQGPARDIGRQDQQLQSLQGQRELARGREQTLIGQLAVLTGSAPSSFAPPRERVLAAPGSLADPGVPADLLAARPDLRAIRLQLEAADRRLAAQVRDWLPSVNLSASVFSIATSLSDLVDELLWSIAGTASQAIFDGGARDARIAGAEARAEELLYSYGESLLAALQEVHSALAANRAQDAFLDSLDQQLEQAGRVLELVREAYVQGAGSYLDVLTALQSLQGLEQQEVDARRQQFSNRVQLCRALGYPVATPDVETARWIATAATGLDAVRRTAAGATEADGN